MTGLPEETFLESPFFNKRYLEGMTIEVKEREEVKEDLIPNFSSVERALRTSKIGCFERNEYVARQEVYNALYEYLGEKKPLQIDIDNGGSVTSATVTFSSVTMEPQDEILVKERDSIVATVESPSWFADQLKERKLFIIVNGNTKGGIGVQEENLRTQGYGILHLTLKDVEKEIQKVTHSLSEEEVTLKQRIVHNHLQKSSFLFSEGNPLRTWEVHSCSAYTFLAEVVRPLKELYQASLTLSPKVSEKEFRARKMSITKFSPLEVMLARGRTLSNKIDALLEIHEEVARRSTPSSEELTFETPGSAVKKRIHSLVQQAMEFAERLALEKGQHEEVVLFNKAFSINQPESPKNLKEKLDSLKDVIRKTVTEQCCHAEKALELLREESQGVVHKNSSSEKTTSNSSETSKGQKILQKKYNDLLALELSIEKQLKEERTNGNYLSLKARVFPKSPSFSVPQKLLEFEIPSIIQLYRTPLNLMDEKR